MYKWLTLVVCPSFTIFSTTPFQIWKTYQVQLLRLLLPRRGGGDRKETLSSRRASRLAILDKRWSFTSLSSSQIKHLTQEFAVRQGLLLTWAHVMAPIEAHYARAPVQEIALTSSLRGAVQVSLRRQGRGLQTNHAESTKVPCLSRQTGVPKWWILVCLSYGPFLSLQRVWLARLVSSGAWQRLGTSLVKLMSYHQT